MIRCRTCTGGDLVEIQCTVCGKSKCIKEFANSQRRDIDFAVCSPLVTLYLPY
jgi:DNA repair protein RAD7